MPQFAYQPGSVVLSVNARFVPDDASELKSCVTAVSIAVMLTCPWTAAEKSAKINRKRTCGSRDVFIFGL